MAIGELTPFYVRQQQVAESQSAQQKAAMGAIELDELIKAKQLMTQPTAPAPAPKAYQPAAKPAPAEQQPVPTGEGVTTTPYDTTPPDITTTIKPTKEGQPTVTISQGPKPSQLPKEAQDKLAAAKTEDEYNKILESYKPTEKPATVEGYQKPAEAAPVRKTSMDEMKDANIALTNSNNQVQAAYDRAELFRKNGLLTQYRKELDVAEKLEETRTLAQERQLRSQKSFLELGGQYADGYLDSMKLDPSQENSNRAWSMMLLNAQDKIGIPGTDLMRVTDINQRQKIAQQFSDQSRTAKEKLDLEIAKLRAKGGKGGVGAQALQRVVQATEQASKDIENVASFGNTISLSNFKTGQTGWLAATKDTMTNRISDKQQQLFDVAFAGMSRPLAVIDAAGAATGLVGLQQSLDKLKPVKGDYISTVYGKFAQAKQIIETGIENALQTEGLTDAQRTALTDFKARVNKAVPFTVQDIAKLEGGGKNISLQDIMVEEKRLKDKGGKKDEAPASKKSDATPAGGDYSSLWS